MGDANSQWEWQDANTPQQQHHTPNAQEHYQMPQSTWQNQKPGIIALRPLGLGDILEGSFASVRANPKVMFGFSTLIMLILGIIQALITYFGGFREAVQRYETLSMLRGNTTEEVLLTIKESNQAITEMLYTALFTFPLLILSSLIFSALLTGILTHAISRSVIGKVSSISSTLESVKKRILPLIANSLLLGLISALVTIVSLIPLILFAYLAIKYQLTATAGVPLTILLTLVFIGSLIYVHVKVSLSQTALVLEEIGPWASIKRSWKLTNKGFWRILGRYIVAFLIIGIIFGIVGVIAGIPGGILTPINPVLGLLVTVIFTALLQGLVVPISSAVICLVYVDQRIRKENFDKTLIAAAQQ
ncbi:glycerophosphoryl diester phosphodiesterase membrane domain-containing protein [Actinomycetaceae bacterium TAE3-ERU4]|nr:glycerophosphoryl diester phosphodiesterase membrane domain-containing protein [Actinomycetaceae bacterium TAE3-ERU4]